MTTTPAPFDPDAYKRTTHDQWQNAAAAWHRWGPTLEEWLGPATQLMLDMTGTSVGGRVLDVAAGAGGQSLAAARRVGPSGRVLATDISSNILKFAAEEATKAKLANVETRTVDGESLDVPEDSFDVAISRVGLIYFPDRQKALGGIRRALKPGGRFGAIVYSTAERNGFFSVPISIIRARAALPPPVPGQPGPFSLGKPGVIEEAYARAGFKEIRTRVVSAPVRMSSAADFVRFARESFGALHQMMTKLSENERAATWTEIEKALGEYDTAHGFEAPCEVIVAVGTK